MQVAVLAAEGEQLREALVPLTLGRAPVWPPVHAQRSQLALPLQRQPVCPSTHPRSPTQHGQLLHGVTCSDCVTRIPCEDSSCKPISQLETSHAHSTRPKRCPAAVCTWPKLFHNKSDILGQNNPEISHVAVNTENPMPLNTINVWLYKQRLTRWHRLHSVLRDKAV